MKTPNSVSIFQSHPDALPAEETAFEPGFEYSPKLLPEVADRTWCEGLAKYLGRRLRREPKNLTVHLQRIYALLGAEAGADQLFAAAIDLNTALGSSGSALQQRILESISSVLTTQQRDYLVAIQSGAADLPLPSDAAITLPRPDREKVAIVAQIKPEDAK